MLLLWCLYFELMCDQSQRQASSSKFATHTKMTVKSDFIIQLSELTTLPRQTSDRHWRCATLSVRSTRHSLLMPTDVRDAL